MPCKHEGGTDPCVLLALRRCAALRAWQNHKQGVRQRGLINELSREQYFWLRAQKCVYCAEPATGVDRVKNEFGYTLENSVPCCKRCNGMKSNQGIKAFVAAVNAAARYCPEYPEFKQRWLRVRETLKCLSTLTTAPLAVAPKIESSASASAKTKRVKRAGSSFTRSSLAPLVSLSESTAKVEG